MPAKVTELGDHSAAFTSWPGRWRDHRAPGRQGGTKGHGAVASRRSRATQTQVGLRGEMSLGLLHRSFSGPSHY